MARKKRKEPKRPVEQEQESVSPLPAEEPPRKFAWIPLWGWALIFVLPLLASEFMFYMAGRIPSMIIFPLAWIGFWWALMRRSDWAIRKNARNRRPR